MLATFRRMSGSEEDASSSSSLLFQEQLRPLQRPHRARRLSRLWYSAGEDGPQEDAPGSTLSDQLVFGPGSSSRRSMASSGPRRAPVSRNVSASTEEALLAAAASAAEARMASERRNRSGSDPVLLFVRNGQEGAEGQGLLAPRVTHQLALESFGHGFTPAAMEDAFVKWRNTLHADVDGVSLLVTVALHLLTLLRLVPGGVGDVGSGPLARLLSPAPAAAGLHWAVLCMAAISLVHAALLTAPWFMRW